MDFRQSEFRLLIGAPHPQRESIVRVGATIIGRSEDCDIYLNDVQVSRPHARLDSTVSTCQLTDLGSTNGTIVDGRHCIPRHPVLLAPGSQIQIGPYELTLERDPLFQQTATNTNTPVDTTSALIRTTDGTGQPAPLLPPGLNRYSRRLLSYLPAIYHPTGNETGIDSADNFMARFLGIFEAILGPIEWTIDNFDLYLDPATAPVDFLPWLTQWFTTIFDETWTVQQRRDFLQDAHLIYARRGTRQALTRALEIYTGHQPEINDSAQELLPFTFEVRLPLCDIAEEKILALIDTLKPAHTLCILKMGSK